MTWLLVGLAYMVFFLVGELRPAAPSAQGTKPRFRRWSLNVGAGALAILGSQAVWGWVAMQVGMLQVDRVGLDWVRVVVLLLSYDLALYAWHRANHRWGFLWRFHAFHHRDVELDTTTALRFHVVEFLLTGFWRLPFLWLLCPTLAEWVLVSAMATLAAGFHHSRFWLPAAMDRVLVRVIVTPRWHWGHHHPQRVFHDAQYGVIFSFWDRIFRSVSLPNDRKIGLEES